MTTLHKHEEIKQHAIERLTELKDSNIYGYDLHNEIFNTDYYIIGRYKAQQWLGEDVFKAINTIKDYEMDNFGQVTTDFSEPEKVVNMYVYIIGEELLNQCDTVNKYWNEITTSNDIEAIINELKAV
jgi:hypothetical protein